MSRFAWEPFDVPMAERVVVGRRRHRTLYASVAPSFWVAGQWTGTIDSDVGGWEQRLGAWRTKARAKRAIEAALRADRRAARSAGSSS